MPAGATKVTGLKIHGSRYGQPQAPKESFLIYFMNKDRKRILHTEMAPYSLFKRGSESWVEIKFETPIDRPCPSLSGWLSISGRPRPKGSTSASIRRRPANSRGSGYPAFRPQPVDFGGDWMIQAIFAK